MGTIIAEILAWIFTSIILDALIKIPGYWIVNILFRPNPARPFDRKYTPESAICICCGLLFWAVVGTTCYGLTRVVGK